MTFAKALTLFIILVVIILTGRWIVLTSNEREALPAEQAIGGPFSLIDGDGNVVTDKDFRGRYMLIYFGYTFCPDVCPTSLQTIAQALDALPADTAAKIVPIFVSVDPERDSPEMMKDYVSLFYPTMVGLTGSKTQVKAAAAAYRVVYAKVKEQGAPPDAYLIDHTALTYLMDPDGKFRVSFPHGMAPKEMADTLLSLVK